MICVSKGNVRKRGTRSSTSPAFVRGLRLCRDFYSFHIQERIQRILDLLPNQSVKMRPNLFIDFNPSGDCLFLFLRSFFMACFSFLLIAVWSL